MPTAFFKHHLKRLPYPVLLRLYYAWYAAAFTPKYWRTQKASGLPSLATIDLASLKSSDTVFILGSGASINDIDAERWAQIARHDSFGFNFWLRHPHLPTLYTFEAVDLQAHGALGREVVSTYFGIMEERADAYAQVPKILTDLLPERLDFLEQLPPAFRQKMYALPTTPVLARDEAELAQNIDLLDRWGLFEPTRRPETLLKYRGTLSMLIALAVALQYRRIVLCGIDLSTPGYFYQDAQRYPAMADFQSSPRTKVHSTLIRKPMLMPMDAIVSALNDAILAPRGIELFVENPSSGLHPMLPVAPESLYVAEGSDAARGRARREQVKQGAQNERMK